jgi:hypothetical protein
MVQSSPSLRPTMSVSWRDEAHHIWSSRTRLAASKRGGAKTIPSTQTYSSYNPLQEGIAAGRQASSSPGHFISLSSGVRSANPRGSSSLCMTRSFNLSASAHGYEISLLRQATAKGL